MLKQNFTRTHWLHLALSTLIILFSLSINNAWASATFTSADEAATSAKNGISLSVTAGSLAKGDYYRVDKGATLTVSAASGNITSIVFTCTTSAYAKTASHSPAGTYTEDGTTVTWTGSASSVTFTAKTGSSNKNFRFTEVVITTAGCANKVALTKGSPSNGSFLLTHFFLTLEAYWTNLGLISEAYRIIPPLIYTMYISRDFEIPRF